MIDAVLNARWPQRLVQLPWGIILLITAIGLFGSVVLYSAAGGSLTPWAGMHATRFGLSLLLMLAVAMVPLGLWLRFAWPIYGTLLGALVAVEAIGALAGGAQRWLDLGIIRLQPSELMKLALVMLLARYYHYLPRTTVGRLAGLWPPALMVGLPMAMVLLQPDLGTAITLLAGGVTLMFLAGLPWRYLLLPGAAGLMALPILYGQLHDYQKRRVSTFLDPESDPLGAGYHITQSKIAIGSGGISGKGFGQGSQSHLDYLPEPQTDFVFATMAEEWGLIGGLALIGAFMILLNWGMRTALQTETMFGRLLAAGLSMTLFFYVVINLAMVMGLAPVVGIPLPLVSYGGSSMLTVMLALGLLMGVWRQRTERLV